MLVGHFSFFITINVFLIDGIFTSWFIFFHKQQHQFFFPLLNQHRMIKIFHDEKKESNKKVIYLLLFIFIIVLFVKQMNIFLNMQFLDGVCYGGNCYVFCHDKICIRLINHDNYQFHIIWKHIFLL